MGKRMMTDPFQKRFEERGSEKDFEQASTQILSAIPEVVREPAVADALRDQPESVVVRLERIGDKSYVVSGINLNDDDEDYDDEAPAVAQIDQGSPYEELVGPDEPRICYERTPRHAYPQVSVPPAPGSQSLSHMAPPQQKAEVNSLEGEVERLEAELGAARRDLEEARTLIGTGDRIQKPVAGQIWSDGTEDYIVTDSPYGLRFHCLTDGDIWEDCAAEITARRGEMHFRGYSLKEVRELNLDDVENAEERRRWSDV